MSIQEKQIETMQLPSKSKAIIIINVNNSGQSGLNLDQTITIAAHQFLS